ncbi:protein kinase [Candidatus Sumerlaeota bacterium]|nr:protein kinase [Candidatus Sumerlaeota bacterium]
MNIALSNIEKLGILREEPCGRVYEGVVSESRRKVLVKELILPPVLDKTSEIRIRKRFIQEAESLKNILNPAIGVPLDFGEEGESAFVIYPLPQGIPMNSHIETRGPMPEYDALHLVKRIAHCYQLFQAHDIHRTNIIPHDFFLQGNASFLFLDTTLCTFDKSYGLYDIGLITGDRNFYAPEQIEKGKSGESSLVFSIGLMLYWLMTGDLLYDGETPFESFSGILSQPYTTLPERLDASLELYDLMRQILQKDEAKRLNTLLLLEQSIDLVIDRERVERTLKEQENKSATRRDEIPREKSAVGTGKFIPWIILVVLVFFMGVQLKKWFFTGYERAHAISAESQENLKTAWRYLANEDIKNARQLATEALNKEKVSPEASLLIGETHLRLDEHEQSLPYFEQGKTSIDDKIRFRSSSLLANSYIRLERFPEAEIEIGWLIDKVETADESFKSPYKKILSELCFLEGKALYQKYYEDSTVLKRLQSVESLMNRVDPASPQMDFIKGIIGYVNKENKHALAYLKRFNESIPGDALVSEILQKLERPASPSSP